MIDKINAAERVVMRGDILAAACDCVSGKRNDRHGEAEDNFRAIADLWEAYTGHHYSSIDVAMMMALLKIARAKSDSGCLDNFIDIAGYAACAGEIYNRASELIKEGDE